VAIQVVTLGNRPVDLDPATFARACLQYEGLVDRQQLALVDRVRRQRDGEQRERSDADQQVGQSIQSSAPGRVASAIQAR